MPYEVGRYRAQWQSYPVLVRQYHPDLNHGITLTQVPPAADVYLLWECDAGHRFVATPTEQRQRPGTSRRRSTWCPECSALAGGARSGGSSRRKARLCARCDPSLHSVGDALTSACAPRTASAAEGELRHRLASKLSFEPALNAVRVAQPFFTHLEVWPDIVLAELRIAVEYDTTGRDGLEHVGRREPVDRRKDRLLRAAGWEVVRIRCGKLQPLGPHDIVAPGVSARLVDRLLDRLGEVRGELIVSSYRT